MRKQKEKKTSYLLLKPTFCSFFLKEKVSVELLLLLASFLKEVQEKVNLFVEFFLSTWQHFFLYC